MACPSFFTVNKEVALPFKTRVALFEGTWQKYHKGPPYATPGANPQKYFRACMDDAEELMSGTGYIKGIYIVQAIQAVIITIYLVGIPCPQ